MDYSWIFGGFIASLLGFITLIYSFKKKRKISPSVKDQRNEALNRRANGKPRSDADHGGVDVIIVGAGIAGSALAYALGKDGWRVHVIERDLTEPQRMAGEFLQPGGYLKLIELDLQDCVNGITDSQEMTGVVFCMGGRSLKLPFPLQNYPSDVYGRSFHHGCFIQKLRKKAASLSNVRFEEGTVTSLVKENGIIKGVHYKTKAGQESTAYAPLTVVSDGCFSNLRRSLCSSKVEITSRFIGFIVKTCDLPDPKYGRAIFTEPSIFIYPIGTNEFRCFVNIIGEKIPSISSGEMANYLKTEVAAQVPPEMRNAFISAIDEKDNIKIATNLSMPASPCPTPGGFLIGDALNLRHPFTAGGMTAAFSDVVLLRDLLRPLNNLSGDPVAICKYLESFYILRKPMACSINAAAGLLSKIFFPRDDPLMREMSEVCFEYMGLGEIFGGGLVSVFAGLSPSPLFLVSHLVGLTVFAVGRSLLPFPSPNRLWAAARLFMGASSVAFSVLKAEGIRETLFPWTLPAYYRGPPPNLR
ncbi:hypothetical protein Tsubulata_027450 [Turnera subulata]|uniref:Squalene monooxygenase n=1 Tax=Turnera subulata TaxID=218843 RepID=A0A9Q0FPA3_9ROSI|nr:hypothetical protein Tsubulata_027450 [Turnera subulata]